MPEIQKEITTEDQHSLPEKRERTTKIVEFPKVVPHEQPEKTYKKEKSLFRTTQIVWYILVLVEVFIFLRLFLKLIAANQFSWFTQFIYGVSDILIMPFRGIVGVTLLGNSLLDWPAVIAAIVYVIVAYLIALFTQLIKPVSPKEVDEKI